MVGHESGFVVDPFCNHSHDFDLGTSGRGDPHLITVADAAVIGSAWVDLNEHVLLQFGQITVGTGFFPATFVFDQTTASENQRKLFSDFFVLVLQTLEQNWQTPRSLAVVVRRVFGYQFRAGRINRLTVLRNGVGEVPDHRTCFGIAKRMAAMVLHEDTNHGTRGVGFPVLAFRFFLLCLGQLTPPSQLFEQQVVEFRVAGGDVCTFGV